MQRYEALEIQQATTKTDLTEAAKHKNECTKQFKQYNSKVIHFACFLYQIHCRSTQPLLVRVILSYVWSTCPILHLIGASLHILVAFWNNIKLLSGKWRIWPPSDTTISMMKSSICWNPLRTIWTIWWPNASPIPLIRSVGGHMKTPAFCDKLKRMWQPKEVPQAFLFEIMSSIT